MIGKACEKWIKEVLNKQYGLGAMDINNYANEILCSLRKFFEIDEIEIVITSNYNALTEQYNIYLHDTVLKRYWVYNITPSYLNGVEPMNVTNMIIQDFKEQSYDNKVR